MSEEACGWAQSERAKNRSAKFVLMRLAAYADAKGVAWAYVSLLASQIDGDDRTVQRALRALETQGLIKRTGAFYGRNVPYYQLDMSGAVRAEMAASNGDSLSPLADGRTVTSEASNGDTGATLKKGNNPSVGSKEPPSGRAGAREDGWIEALRDEAFAAMPEAAKRGVSSDREWDEAWASEMAGGADPRAMAAGARAYAADRTLWGSSGRPIAAHNFLIKGRWKALGEKVVAVAGAVAPPSAWAGPAEIRGQVVGLQGESFAVKYLDPAIWNGAAVVAFTRYAAGQLRQALRKSDIEVLDPPAGGMAVSG